MKKLLLVLALLVGLGAYANEFPDPVTITVMNRYGKEVATYVVNQGSNKKVALVFEGLPPGRYTMRVRGETHDRLIIIHIR